MPVLFRRLQKELGLQISAFPDLNLPSLDSSEEDPEYVTEELQRRIV